MGETGKTSTTEKYWMVSGGFWASEDRPDVREVECFVAPCGVIPVPTTEFSYAGYGGMKVGRDIFETKEQALAQAVAQLESDVKSHRQYLERGEARLTRLRREPR